MPNYTHTQKYIIQYIADIYARELPKTSLAYIWLSSHVWNTHIRRINTYIRNTSCLVGPAYWFGKIHGKVLWIIWSECCVLWAAWPSKNLFFKFYILLLSRPRAQVHIYIYIYAYTHICYMNVNLYYINRGSTSYSEEICMQAHARCFDDG